MERPVPTPFRTRGPIGVADDDLPLPVCLRCRTDVSRLDVSARFCPRCGADLLDAAVRPPPVPVIPIPGSADELELRACREAAEWLRRLDEPADAPPSPARDAVPTPDRSAPAPDHLSGVITGYANALYRLGWRYEHGTGFGRNVAEAVRCYLKSAKLGNPGAKDRLMPRCVADRRDGGTQT